MSSLNINTLFEEMDQKVLNRLKMFDDILVQIHNKIKLSSKNKTLFCTFQIPEFLIGKPIYKIEDLRKYLINSLNNKMSSGSPSIKEVNRMLKIRRNLLKEYSNKYT